MCYDGIESRKKERKLSWWKIALLAIAGIIVLGAFMLIADRVYKKKYNYHLYNGGIALIVAAAVILAGYIILKTSLVLGILLIALGIIIFLAVGFFDVRKCGIGGGIIGLIVQSICCIPCFFALFAKSKDKDKTYNENIPRRRRRYR